MRRDIQVEIDGRTFGGTFEEKGGMVHVYGDGGGTKVTQTGNMTPTVLAKMLLREIVREQLAEDDK